MSGKLDMDTQLQAFLRRRSCMAGSYVLSADDLRTLLCDVLDGEREDIVDNSPCSCGELEWVRARISRERTPEEGGE